MINGNFDSKQTTGFKKGIEKMAYSQETEEDKKRDCYEETNSRSKKEAKLLDMLGHNAA